MIFLKHFHATRQSLCGICKIHMPSASKVNDLIPIINERMKWASGTPLKLYEVTFTVVSLTFPLMPHFLQGNQTWHGRANEAEVHLH